MELLDQLRAQLKAALEERSTAKDAADAVLAGPAAEKRDLNDDEATAWAEARDKVKALDADIAKLDERIKGIEDAEAADAAANSRAQEFGGTAPQPPAHVRSEEPAYSPRGKASFFGDALQVRYGFGGDNRSGDRIERHLNEVRDGKHGQPGAEFRDVGTTTLGALVVPQYLVDMYAEVLRAGRVTSNIVMHPPMPDEGMVFTIPRGNTGTLVAAQTTQNTAVEEQDFTEVDLPVYVRTYAGQQDVSRQSLERGANVDAIIWADLTGAYSVSLNTGVIAGAGTNNTHTGILNTSGVSTVTALTATAQSLLSRIALGISEINGERFQPATAIVMHPRRWGFFSQATDTSGRPLIPPRAGGPQNAFGTGDAAAYGYVGDIFGLPVYTDACIPTTLSTSTQAGSTEDRILIMKASDNLLFEDDVAPRQLRFEETLGGSLTVKLVAYNYSAFTAGWHPEGTVVIAGSGLTTPTFG